MDRNLEIIKSCEIIQRELTKLNKNKCFLDLCYHQFIIVDKTIEPKKIPTTVEGVNLDLSNQIVYELTQK